jgi:hypothetical protein
MKGPDRLKAGTRKEGVGMDYEYECVDFDLLYLDKIKEVSKTNGSKSATCNYIILI